MSNLLSRQDRWAMWMAATPGSESSGHADAHSGPTRTYSPESLQAEIQRLRGVLQAAVSALVAAGAHREASRISQAVDAR